MLSRLRTFGLAALVSLLVTVALARIIATWTVYTPTFDEAAHLAAGIEWLDKGVYRYEEMHTPLARVAMATGPYLDGSRTIGRPGIWQEGYAILNQRGDPQRLLTLARLGILPFFIFSAILVFAWARDLANDTTAVLAVLAFTSLPAVLAHSGIATTDAATMATVCATAFAMVRWLERPTPGRTIWLGLTAGLALLAKMSSLVFLPAVGLAVVIAWMLGRNPLLPYAGRAVAAGLIMLITLWAGYRFSVGPLRRGPVRPPATAAAPAHAATAVPLKTRLQKIARLPVFPAPEYYRGIQMIRGDNRLGRRNYVLGEPIQGGRWYFFPLALGVKTPIPFLILTCIGGATLVAMGRRRPSALVPVLASTGIFATAMAANINIGVRHIQPIFPMLSICAGLGMLRLWHWRPRRPWTGPALAAALTGWLGLESARAHPDYLPYFNQLAGSHPDEVLVDSDLDWGQDLGRLVDTLRARRVEHVWIAYHGKNDLSKVGLPPHTELTGYSRQTGWIAASMYRIQLGYYGGAFDPFAWLKEYTPVTRAGRSINLYYIPPDSTAPAGAAPPRP